MIEQNTFIANSYLKKVLERARSCSDRREFFDKHRDDYLWLGKNNLLRKIENLFSKKKMIAEKNRKEQEEVKNKINIELERVLCLAKDCYSEKDFSRKHPKEKAWIYRNMFLDKLRGVLPKDKKVWDLESSIEEAKKFPNREVFSKTQAYKWLLKNNRAELDKVFPRVKFGVEHQKFKLEFILKAACECETRKEFFQKNPNYRAWLQKKRLTSELNSIFPREAYKTRTIGNVIEEANKYSSRESFLKKDITSYRSLMRLDPNKLDELFPDSTWNFNTIMEEASKFSNMDEFRANSKEAWEWAVRYVLINGIRKKIFKENRKLGVSNSLEEARRFKTRRDFELNGGGHYQWLMNKKLSDKLEEILPNTFISWTLESALAESKNYKNRKEFMASKAYRWIRNQNKLKEVDKIFPPFAIMWTLETAIEEAKKYNSRKHLRLESSVYQWFVKNKRMDIVEELFPKILTGNFIRENLF